MSKVFLDSGIFIAFLNRNDRHHAQAVTLFQTAQRVRWFTSAFVRAEAYAWFVHKYGEEAAPVFSLLLGRPQGSEGARFELCASSGCV